MKKNILLSIAAGFLLFAWGYISWTVLPWHMQATHQFTNEAAVIQTFKENAPQQGVYFLPRSAAAHDPAQPSAFANVLPHGSDKSMVQQMLGGLAIEILSAFLVFHLLCHTTHLSYWKKVIFFSLTGLVIGFAGHAMDWNWFNFPLSYVAVTIVDFWIGWTMVGLALAKFTGKEVAAQY